jgi:hypothetical protein
LHLSNRINDHGLLERERARISFKITWASASLDIAEFSELLDSEDEERDLFLLRAELFFDFLAFKCYPGDNDEFPELLAGLGAMCFRAGALHHFFIFLELSTFSRASILPPNLSKSSFFSFLANTSASRLRYLLI